jgi:hypothetical protein
MYITVRVQDDESHRHWCPRSEKYASGEVLPEYLGMGWVPDKLLDVETFCFGGHRHVDVYYFTLRHGKDCIAMPVLANPAVLHVIVIHRLTLQSSDIGQAETQAVSALDVQSLQDRYSHGRLFSQPVRIDG